MLEDSPMARLKIEDLKKYSLMFIKSDGHEFVTLVFDSSAFHPRVLSRVYVFLFDCTVREADWNCTTQLPVISSVGVSRNEAGRDGAGVAEFSILFSNGRLLFECADYEIIERKIPITPWPGGQS